ncbi:hypothetical protein HWV62_1665 [Athelia sp. TMB]|nr:hypothetical protein HWV62_1665 [Athelia sp. TMB]
MAVCADDADVIFRSCDGTLFKIHLKNLETNSEGFSPPSGTSSRGEIDIVSLTENGDTLDLLFQYIYPQRHPDLAEIDFKQLAELSEAAEKYRVFAAMTRDMLRGYSQYILSEAYADHSFEVMLYAMRHGYEKLMDKAEKIALGVSQTLAFECFTPQVYNAWVSY